MECHGGVALDVEKSIEILHEVGHKLWTAIADDYLGHPMSCVNFVTHDFGPAFRGQGGAAGNQNDFFGKSVYDHDDHVVAIAFWPACNHVDGDMHPWSGQDFIWVKWHGFGLIA